MDDEIEDDLWEDLETDWEDSVSGDCEDYYEIDPEETL